MISTITGPGQVPEKNVRMNAGSEKFLAEQVENKRWFFGKISIAVVNGETVVGLGRHDDFHAQIIDRASREEWKASAVFNLSKREAQKAPGVIVEGGRFTVYLASEIEVKVESGSECFGGFKKKLFSRPTEEVLVDLLTSKLQAITGAPPHKTISNDDGWGELSGPTRPAAPDSSNQSS